MSNDSNTLIQERILELMPFMTSEEMRSVAYFEEVGDYESILPILTQIGWRHAGCNLDISESQVYDTEHNIRLEVF